jgi:hypothetical protein
VEEWLERKIGVKVDVKKALKIDKDKMMLAKRESWEHKKKIMLNKSKLKERKGERMYIDDDLTNEEGKQKKLREVDREERDRGKRVKVGYKKIQINGEWFCDQKLASDSSGLSGGFRGIGRGFGL